MNQRQKEYLIRGSAMASRIGIRGIQACNGGGDLFSVFASGDFRQMLPGQIALVHYDNTPELSPQGLIQVDAVYCLFFTGARGVAHGSAVLDGLAETYEGTSLGACNQRLADACFARWEPRMRLRDFAEGVVIFGHSFGGACAESLGERLAMAYPSIPIRVETYGSPRSCIAGRYRRPENLRSVRNLNEQDVVSHVPYTSAEARLAAAITPSRVMRAFNASGHPGGCRVFSPSGQFVEAGNNTIPVSDTTLTIAAWVTYAQHLTHRAHELATYVSSMDAFAARSLDGPSPTDDVSVPEQPTLPPTPPVIGEEVTGSGMTPEEKREWAAEQERLAQEAFSSGQQNRPAIAVVHQGVAGVMYRGEVRVSASDRRAAKRLAKKLNQMRRILGPCTTDQRAQLLEAMETDLVGPI